MSLRVFWSDRLEELADRMLDEWIDRPVGGNPFERICVAVGDMATRNWLKDRFLLHREHGRRRILANIDFKPLPELVNDWLAAAVHGESRRDPADHPFSKGVMAWRIDAILREKAGDPEFKTLADYIAAGGDAAEDRRRFDLATRLAQMFDDYLVSRHAMLRKWEGGFVPSGGDERWQALLYRELVRNAGSYAADYAKALGPATPASAAFAAGFPRYTAIHVFDVPDAPWPYLEMLKKLSDEIPVTFWTFNPSRDFWLENPTKGEQLREKAAQIRQALANGENPPEEKPGDPDFSSPDARLLASLATGARGLLAHELDLTEGDFEWLGKATDKDFATLRSATTEVHVCHSPRRELEATRDALHSFFKEHTDAKPSDALILCADWETYSPLVEAVFGGKDGAGLPFATAGMGASSPVAHSYGELLDFRANRFEITKVFALLGITEIRGKFGITPDDVMVLRDMVGKDNIHWGFDDADVRCILGQPAEAEGDERSRFTWQRGLDRLTLDALLGPREDEEAPYEAGPLGWLLPQGHIESERADAVGGLFRFTKRLMRFRRLLQSPHTAEEWRDGLLEAIDDFYQAQDASLGEILGLRKAVESVSKAAIRAQEIDGRKSESIAAEVFCREVLDSVKNAVKKLSSAGDAVRVAPLANGTAVPARFVWICGLNDGSFPRTVYRPTFDQIGRHPAMYDVTPRERDTLALLKAALGARDKLCLSYVGRDIRTNAELPPAVPLTDLLEWFGAAPIKTYGHPLQSYSGRYFTDPNLPRGFSSANHAAAAALATARASGADAGKSLPQVVPFPLSEDDETTIELDDLVAFLEHPNRYIAEKRLGIRVKDSAFKRLDDDDQLDAGLPFDLSILVKIRGKEGVSDAAGKAEALSESGVPLTEDEIVRLADETDSQTAPIRERLLSFTTTDAPGYQVQGKTAMQALAKWQDHASATPFSIDFEIDGHHVVVNGVRKTIPLDVIPSGAMEHSFSFSAFSYDKSDSRVICEKRLSWVRHLAGHAAGGRFVTAMVFGGLKDPVKTYRPVEPEEAKRLLEQIVHLVTEPFPFDFTAVSTGAGDPKNTGKGGSWKKNPEKDTLPDDWNAVIGDLNSRIVSTHQPRGKQK